ncbi:MAG: [FeFe] hydrogenase H-cluster radical SAM maturase HydE [Candidatus Omnitrophota bacterium]
MLYAACGVLIMTYDEILFWLTDGDFDHLTVWADRVRREFCGEDVHLRGLIEFSNHCSRACGYCGLRQANSKLERYRMSLAEIFAAVQRADTLGYGTVVLQSGEDKDYSISAYCDLLNRIKQQTGCAVTLCIGEKTREEYQALRGAGMDRYLLRFETSDPDLFAQIKPDSSYENRLRCLRDLKSLGVQTGSGIMVGLPGQTAESLARDILLMRDLDLDMIGLGPFLSHPQTPLAGAPNGLLELSLRVLALTRIVTRNTHMPATTAMGSLDPLGRQKALKAGANVLMPNVTPQKYRAFYEIYPNKICVNDQPGDCRTCISAMVQSLGRTIAGGPGHSLKAVTRG